MKRTACFSILVVLTFSVFANKDEDLSNVTIPGAEQQKLYSKIVEQEYQLFVHLPGGYDKATEHYPVIYLLDAQWDFPLLTSLYGQLRYDGFVPDAIIVGITWGGDKPNPDVLRARDFTPTKIDQVPNSGGGKAFLEFIKKELIPFIGKEYRSNEQRVLIGSSLGGLFTFYTLFTEPQLFTGYIPTAAASGWDNGAVYSFAENFAKHSEKLRPRVYSAVGTLDGLETAFVEMEAFFAEKNYPGLNLKTQKIAGLGHAGIKSNGNTFGLQHVFQRPILQLSSQQLDLLKGGYTSSDGKMKLQVFHENSQLVVIDPDGDKRSYTAADPNNFYLPGTSLDMHFDLTGESVTLTVKPFQGEYLFTREN